MRGKPTTLTHSIIFKYCVFISIETLLSQRLHVLLFYRTHMYVYYSCVEDTFIVGEESGNDKIQLRGNYFRVVSFYNIYLETSLFKFINLFSLMLFKKSTSYLKLIPFINQNFKLGLKHL